jgi:hypothetical protein
VCIQFSLIDFRLFTSFELRRQMIMDGKHMMIWRKIAVMYLNLVFQYSPEDTG